MPSRFVFRALIVLAIAFSAIAVPACQSTQRARPEAFTGESDVAHDRHATGIDSHNPD